VSEEAKAHFKRGLALVDDPDGPRYEEAYDAFKAAYAASPSPKILGNLGQCAMKLERDGEAIAAFERYLAEVADIDPAERDQIARDLDTLRAGAGKLELYVGPGGATITDERVPVRGARVVNRYRAEGEVLTLLVRAGHHAFTVRREGREPASFELEIAAGASVQKTVELERVEPPRPPPVTAPREPERPVPISVWIGAGVTGALAVGAVVTGAVALGKKSDFDAINDGSRFDEAQQIRDSGKTLNIVTDVLLGAAVVSAGVTAVLFLTRPDVRTGSRGSSVAVGVDPGARTGALVLRVPL
jgi:hypothetical protein